MKIALINENSQERKNALIYKILERVARKHGAEVFNYGVSEENDADIDYVGAGLLTGILLNSHAVDFVITGCATGQGVMMVANSLPNVNCGFVSDEVDAKLFMKINAGNAISIPFGKYFGVGTEYMLEGIFEAILSTDKGSGYPNEKREIQEGQRDEFFKLKQSSQINMAEILEETDKDLLRNIINNDYFQEKFFEHSLDDEISESLKNIIDAFE